MRFALVGLTLLLGACGQGKDPPLYLTSGPIPIPDHCDPARTPPMQEPKLDPKQDATDIEAVKDRERWKQAFRTEKAYRATCNRQLKALTGDKRAASKPTS